MAAKRGGETAVSRKGGEVGGRADEDPTSATVAAAKKDWVDVVAYACRKSNRKMSSLALHPRIA